jgi:hypothetical protein
MKTQLECGVSGSMAAVLGRSVQLHLVGSARGLSNTVCFRSHARQCLSLQAENCLGSLGHVPMNRTFRFSMLRIIRFRAQTVLPRCATRRSTEVRDSVSHTAWLRGALTREKPIVLVADNPDDIHAYSARFAERTTSPTRPSSRAPARKLSTIGFWPREVFKRSPIII